jgi:cytochrome b
VAVDVSRFEKRQIWDVVTRIWHWLLAIVVTTVWMLGEFMSFETIQWHFYLGYGVLALLAFRLLWGLIGPEPVRFKSFHLSPASVTGYLSHFFSRSFSGEAGHSPLGALSVVLMLAALAGQAVTGLFIESEDFFEYGPLAQYVSDDVIRLMSAWHHRLAKVVLLLVGFHLTAIAYYRVWKRENLVVPMITGWKWVKRNNKTD